MILSERHFGTAFFTASKSLSGIPDFYEYYHTAIILLSLVSLGISVTVGIMFFFRKTIKEYFRA
jgi:hypothetical protein